MKRAIAVGSMNCLTTEYAIVLAKHCEEVVHYYDASESDSLSNPKLRWGDDSSKITEKLTIKKIFFRFYSSYLLPAIFHRKLISDLNRADLIILSGFNISLARKIKGDGKTIIAMGFGSDISHFCDRDWPQTTMKNWSGWKRLLIPLRPIRRVILSKLVELQISGMRSCTHYSYFYAGLDPSTDALINRILEGDNKPKRLPRVSINLDTMEMTFKFDHLARFRGIYKILFPVRFNEARNGNDDKGWRVLFDSLQLYRRQSNLAFVCVCFKKGDYALAQSYAKEIGVDDLLEWRDVVPWSDLQQYFHSADVIVEQLGSHWIGIGWWAMALGKPVIGKINNHAQRAFFQNSGLLFVEDKHDLAEALLRCESSDARERIGKLGREFVQCHSRDNEVSGWGIL